MLLTEKYRTLWGRPLPENGTEEVEKKATDLPSQKKTK